MFTHILLPLDGSQFAESALPAAFELAKRFHSKVTLLSIVRPPYLMGGSGAGYTEMLINLRDQAVTEAHRYLEGHQHWLNYEGIKASVRVSEMEPVAEAILETADEVGADLIVMSTHGRGGISRWVYGSVADKVLRHATIPVMLVRATEEGDEPTSALVQADAALGMLPEEESADVLSRRVAEKQKPTMAERLVDEHMVDRTSR